MLDLEERATTPERRNRIREIARRYQQNIRNTKTFQNDERQDKIKEWPGDTEDRFYRRYGRSTYMGISG